MIPVLDLQAQYRTIQALGGIIGLGHGGGSTEFVETFKKVTEISGNRQISIGTDVNGLFPLPGRPASNERISYSSDLTKCTMGTKAWDYNKEGFAHYGLFPDF